MTSIYILLVFMIVGALIALELCDLLSSVIAIGAVGLGLVLAALLLKAPDVALTQLVVEIIAVIILIRATLKPQLSDFSTERNVLAMLVGFVFFAVLLGVVWSAVQELPPFGSPHLRATALILEEGLARTGATNLVTAVLLDVRAHDTLGEATVLFTAVIAVLTVVRRVGRRPLEEPKEEFDA